MDSDFFRLGRERRDAIMNIKNIKIRLTRFHKFKEMNPHIFGIVVQYLNSIPHVTVRFKGFIIEHRSTLCTSEMSILVFNEPFQKET